MDSRPFRAPRQTSREESSRIEQPPSRPELVDQPEPDKAEPTGRPLVETPRRNKTPKNTSWVKWLVVAVVVIVILVAAWFAWRSLRPSTDIGIDSSKYQAVFTADGQVYFGKLEAEDGGYLKLTDAYYLQSKQSSDDSDQTDTSSNLQLTKLHSKIYGPSDEVVFQKDQLLYFENLRDDGQVAKLIQKDTGSN